MEYVKENIEITCHSDPANAWKLLCERGALYCEDSINHQLGHPDLTIGRPPTLDECEFMGCGQHGDKPLISFEEDGRCSSVPTSATLIFIRFPDGRINFFEHGKPLLQLEIAEALCLCGICQKRWEKRAADPATPHDFVFKQGNKKNMYAGVTVYGLANRKYQQYSKDRLNNRYLAWIDAMYDDQAPNKRSLVSWMLKDSRS